MEYKVNGTTFYGELAAAAAEIPADDWDYFAYVDDISDQIFEYMEQQGINKATLAKKLGTSRAFVTKVLNGDMNMTQKTFVKILSALGAKPKTKIVPKNEVINWCALGFHKKGQNFLVPGNFSPVSSHQITSSDRELPNAA